jgi:NADH:ubiquinone oxidoreductase subunit 6 (subunit J)
MEPSKPFIELISMILNCIYVYLVIVMAFNQCFREYEQHFWRTKYTQTYVILSILAIIQLLYSVFRYT